MRTPAWTPDLITKLAFDPNKAVHIEGAGILSTTQTYNPATFQTYTKTGGGFEFNSNFQVFKNFRVIENFTYGDGIGRYFFGQSPDAILYNTGSAGNIHSGGTVDGVEFNVAKKTALYAYYGGMYAGRTTTIDPLTHKPVGYGGAGSATGNNRTIQEATFGLQQTFWRDPKWGALQFYAQYSYLFRDPWYLAPHAPRQADTNMLFLESPLRSSGRSTQVEVDRTEPVLQLQGPGSKDPGLRLGVPRHQTADCSTSAGTGLPRLAKRIVPSGPIR